MGNAESWKASLSLEQQEERPGGRKGFSIDAPNGSLLNSFFKWLSTSSFKRQIVT